MYKFGEKNDKDNRHSQAKTGQRKVNLRLKTGK